MVAASDYVECENEPPQLMACNAMVRVSWSMACGVPFPFQETSRLYENEDLKECRIPTLTPIEQVQDESGHLPTG